MMSTLLIWPNCNLFILIKNHSCNWMLISTGEEKSPQNAKMTLLREHPFWTQSGMRFNGSYSPLSQNILL